MLRIHRTVRDTGLKHAEASGRVERPAESADAVIVGIDAGRQFQRIEGFGGAFTESAAVNWLGLSAGARDDVLRAYFASPAQGGHGYTLCRMPMNSCDFALGHYAHVEQEGDVELRSFNMERDRGALLALALAAGRIAGTPPGVLVSPWSPPAWMKDNARMRGGGRLLPQYREAWARCFVRFIQECRREGLRLWGVTVQNEPMAAQTWDSCLYSAEEERDFIAQYLGPALRDAGLSDVRILGWDHNRDQLGERARVLYADPVARGFLWGLGFHWYGEPMFENVHRVHEGWPEKGLLLTEACQEGGPHRDDWGVAERYGQSLIADLGHGSCGWIDWNLFLDLQGGPNHVGNYCSAPILIDAGRDQWFAQPSYHYIGHFSRHIEPGSRRVFCATSSHAIQATAFRRPDGALVVVAMNTHEHAQALSLRIDSHAQADVLPAHSIATYVRAVGPD